MHHRFGGLRKDYETPFGTARTDRDALESLAAELPFGFFDDEWAHRSEHSIEFQIVWLQHVFGGNLKAGIVPVLAGSFHEFSEAGASPLGDPQVAGFTQALRKLVEARRGKVCVVAGVDFAHIGGRFGDEEAMNETRRARLEHDDRAMLDAILSCDAEEFHPQHCRGQGRAAHLRLPSHLHVVGSASAGNSAAPRLRPVTRAGDELRRQFRQRGVLPLTACLHQCC